MPTLHPSDRPEPKLPPLKGSLESVTQRFGNPFCQQGLTDRRTACREARLVRVPNIESIREEQKRFLKEFDRQVAEIEKKRAEAQAKPIPHKDSDSAV